MIKKRFLYSLLSYIIIMQTFLPTVTWAETTTQPVSNDFRELAKKERAIGKKKKESVEKSIGHERYAQKGLTVQSVDGDTPSMLSGNFSNKTYRKESDILSFLEEKKLFLKLKEPRKELSFKKKSVDKKENVHYRFQQKFQDIPIYGAEVIVHTDRKGSVYAYNSKYQQPDRIRVNIKAGISKDRAAQSAISYVESTQNLDLSPNTQLVSQSSKELIIYPFKDKYYLAYHIQLSFKQPQLGRWMVFVDAHTGNVINGFNTLAHEGAVMGTGMGYFGEQRTFPAFQTSSGVILKDMTRGQATIDTIDFQTWNHVSDQDGHFDDEQQKTAVDVHYYGGVVYNYFYQHFNRLSFDNRNSSVPIYVHVDEFGEPMNNAYWDGTGLYFGDGDGNYFSPLSSQLDVVAHEYAHGVTEYSAGLEYYGQSGALNESISDIFGSLIEGDWLIGEDVFTPAIPGDALRSMENPALFNQPGHMDDYVYTFNDNGGVHTNSGIPNRAAYLIATSLNQQGIDGKDRLGQITYWALNYFLGTTSDFNDARNGFLLAAQTLYGIGSPEYMAVDEAWRSVGVPYEEDEEIPVELEDPYEENDTFSEASLIEWGSHKPYLSSSVDVDWFKINVTEDTHMAISFGDYEIYADGRYTMEIYDANSNLLQQFDSGLLYSDNELPFYGEFTRQQVAPGTYYLKVYSNNEVYGQTPYLFTVTQDYFELNDVPSEASFLQLGDSIQSYLTHSNDDDYYQFTLTENKKVEISLSELPGDYDLYLYDSDAPENWIAFSVNDLNISEKITMPLTPGTYYVKVWPFGVATPLTPYRLTLHEETIDEYDSQFTWYQEYVASYRGKEVEVLVDLLNSGAQEWDSEQVKLGVAGGNAVSGSDKVFDGGNVLFGETWYTSIKLQVPNQLGDYIVPLQMYREDSSGQKIFFGQKVEVHVKVVDDPLEPNNWYTEASPIIGGQPVTSEVSYWADDDYYVFHIDQEQDVSIHLSNMSADYDLYLTDKNGEDVGVSETEGMSDEVITAHLMPGFYYIIVWAYDFTETGDQTYRLLLDAETVDAAEGDFDHDGDQDSEDLESLKDSYGETGVTEKNINDQGHSTGIVDVFDIISWIKKYNP